MAKDGVGGRNPPMTSQRQIQTSAHAVTRNRRVDRSLEAVDLVHQLLAVPCEFVCSHPG
jgi:hypothetical protein